MSDNKQRKHKEKFSEFDLFSLPKQSVPHQLKFESDTPVSIYVNDEHMYTTIRGITIEISGKFTNDQQILMDLFSKGLYYKNLTKYVNFFNFLRSLRSARGKIKEKGLEIGYMLKDAIDGKIAGIKILENGTTVPLFKEDFTIPNNANDDTNNDATNI